MTQDSLGGTFEDLVADVLEKSCNQPLVSTNPKDIRHTGSVNVESTEPEHANLFIVRGRLSARQDHPFSSGVYVLPDRGATSDIMSMQTAKTARLPLYKRKHPGHVMIAGDVQVEVRYYTRGYVRLGEFLFQHHFKILKIVPDVVLGLPLLGSYNATVNWKERCAVVQHGSTSYQLSFDETRG